MQLDREDGVPPGSTAAAPATDSPPSTAPAAWFASPVPQVAVTVKKRRALDTTEAVPIGAPAGHGGTADERSPRVFVLPKEPTPLTAGTAPGIAADPAGPGGHAPAAPKRRRRRLPEQQPSPVVLIVPGPVEPGPAAVAPAGPGFVLELPELDAWREVQAALVGVRRLVDDAAGASRWRADPGTRRQRRAG